MQGEELERLLHRHQAVLKGHFLLTSGYHADTYVEKFRILENPDLLRQFVAARLPVLRSLRPDVVVGPTTGGILVAYEVARQLGIRAYYAERHGERRVFRRGFVFTEGMRVLLADDVLTTGSSLQATVQALPRFTTVVGAFVLIDRRKEEGDLAGIPVYRAVRMALEAFPPEVCPLCRDGVPLTVRGKGTA